LNGFAAYVKSVFSGGAMNSVDEQRLAAFWMLLSVHGDRGCSEWN